MPSLDALKRKIKNSNSSDKEPKRELVEDRSFGSDCSGYKSTKSVGRRSCLIRDKHYCGRLQSPIAKIAKDKSHVHPPMVPTSQLVGRRPGVLFPRPLEKGISNASYVWVDNRSNAPLTEPQAAASRWQKSLEGSRIIILFRIRSQGSNNWHKLQRPCSHANFSILATF